MLLTKNLIENVDEQFIPMLKMVNIPDFTKCIAQFSGLNIADVSDDQIKEYLLIWARNKYRFFKLFKDKLRYDSDIIYSYSREDIQEEVSVLEKAYPTYSPWLRGVRGLKKNKIESDLLSWEMCSWIKNFDVSVYGMSITRFFKHYLNAPDLLVTRIGKIFELDDVKSNYTLSIDPVDMMLASEAIYGVGSCYKLAQGCPDSHADGCIAALLDDTHTIAYIWDEEKPFNMYNRYKFKAVRYKRVRQWVSISPSMKSIHFNSTYPSETRYREDVKKALRKKVEELIAAHLNIEDEWRKAEDAEVEREYYYGYSEYCSEYVYEHSSLEKSEYWNVFTEPYKCPCGCGKYLEASGDLEDEYESEVYYDGEGFSCGNFYTNEYCEYSGRACRYACDCCYDCCCDCYAWQDAHPRCGIDEDEICDAGICDTYHGVVNCSEENCKNCPFWEEHKRALKEDEAYEDEE